MPYKMVQSGRNFELADVSVPGIFTRAAQPAAGSVITTIERVGSFIRMSIALNSARISVTDAAASGSSGSLTLGTFRQGAILPVASRQNYTAFAEGSALTGGAGDAVFKMGLGSVAANAGDAALTGTEVDFAPATSNITLSGGTGSSGTVLGGIATSPIDGTATATSLILNWSGTAASIDANSTIDVTGTIDLVFIYLGDD